jgi:hypothetical protein
MRTAEIADVGATARSVANYRGEPGSLCLRAHELNLFWLQWQFEGLRGVTGRWAGGQSGQLLQPEQPSMRLLSRHEHCCRQIVHGQIGTSGLRIIKHFMDVHCHHVTTCVYSRRCKHVVETIVAGLLPIQLPKHGTRADSSHAPQSRLPHPRHLFRPSCTTTAGGGPVITKIYL